MKIILGTNTHGEYHRQNVALQSLRHLSTEFQIDVYDVQFVDEKQRLNRRDGIKYMFELNRSSVDLVPGSTKKLPVISDVLNVLASVDCDYFIYVNSDVILNGNLIKYILQNDPGSFTSSRLDVGPVDDFQQILDKNVTPIRYEIAGFDVFVFCKKWFTDNSELFDDFLIGQPCWDQCYAMIIKLFGGNHRFGNVYPPYCFHVMHEPTWQVDREAPERVYNHTLAEKPLNNTMYKIFDIYLSEILVKRQPQGKFLHPVDDEESIEHHFFKRFI